MLLCRQPASAVTRPLPGRITVLTVLMTCAVAQAQPAAMLPPTDAITLFNVTSVNRQRTIIEIDKPTLANLIVDARDTFDTTIPIDAERNFTAHLTTFTVSNEGTTFVLVSDHQQEQVLTFDPRSKILLLRGQLEGFPQSSVFLALSYKLSAGFINVAPGSTRYLMSSSSPNLAPGQIAVFQARDAGASVLPENIHRCGVEDVFDFLVGSDAMSVEHREDHPEHAHRPAPTMRRITGAPALVPGTRTLELAVETDNDYFSLFADAEEAATYTTILYAAVSDVYMRDVNTRVVLSFVRFFESAGAEPAFMDEPDPLVPFRDYWNDNMQAVPRDATQFFSGRRDLPYGGVAYVSALCGDFAYNVVGYALGMFPGPDVPANGHYDLTVCAHELGHNCGTFHTHDYDLDNCNELDNDPQRGTIMSYCSQTVSGGEANIDGRFHAVPQAAIQEYLSTEDAECVINDCNLNDIDDADDITADSSDDNGNGIPDECEDCNGNGTLDDEDIASGAADVNTNGIPDICEPDCNANGIPDEWEVSEGATDLWGHNYPDTCDEDCDGNGVSDYNQLQDDLSLDANRNLALDACEDCDNDGTPDLVALDGTHNVWLTSLIENYTGEFHADTGVLLNSSEVGHIDVGTDLIITADRRILVASSGNDRVVEFDHAGNFVGNLIFGAGGLSMPTGLAIGPNGNLFVSSGGTDNVLEYDVSSGAFVGEFVGNGSGGLNLPRGLTFGPNGNLFVCSSLTDEVIEYNGGNGGLVGVFVDSGDGGLDNPHGLVFKPDGNLLVTSHDGDALPEYDGVTGAFIAKFNKGGTDTNLSLDGPWTARIGPNGNVFVSRLYENGQDGPPGGSPRSANLHITSTRIYEFDIANGNFISSYVTGNDTGFFSATGFDFMPGDLDCNVNYFPDNCDIASGYSADENGDGIPDECGSPCTSDTDGNGAVDINDLLTVLAQWGTSGPEGDVAPDGGDGIVDVIDLLQLLADWGPCS